MVAFKVAVMLAGLVAAPTKIAQPDLQDAGCAARSAAFGDDAAQAHRSLTNGRTRQAIRFFRQAFAICPGDYANALNLASAEIRASEMERAERLLKRLLQQRDTADLHSLLAQTLASEKDFKGSAAQFQLAAEKDPNELNIFDFGTALMKVNFGAATQILRYGLTTFPDSVRMRVSLAVALYAQDQPEEGAKMLCEAAKLNPRDVHPMEVLAATEVVPQSIQPEAERRLAELKALYPDDGLVLFDYAMVKSGRWSGQSFSLPADLMPMLTEVLKLDPHLAKAYVQLALLHDQQKNIPAEIAALRKAVAIDPSVDKIHYRLAFAYRANGDMAAFNTELAKYQELHAKTSGK